jgi:hypothetical protein
MAEQLQFPFPSLDFPGRVWMRVDEVAEKFGVTAPHVINLIIEGKLLALDHRGAGSARATYRIPIEAYRDYVVRAMTTPIDRMRLLRDLPAATRRELIRELQASLKTA